MTEQAEEPCVEKTIPTGRAVACSMGQASDLLAQQVSGSDPEHRFYVRLPLACVQDVGLLVFDHSKYCDNNLTMDQVLAIAEKYTIHPDLVRQAGLQLYKLWKAGNPYTCVISLHVAEPSLPLEDPHNMSNMHTF